MKIIWCIMVKEWKAFFYTPFAMMIIPLYLVLSGSYFTANLDVYMAFARPNETLQMVQGLNVMGFLLNPFYESLFNIYVFIVALITMRVFAEEKKSATYELLVSYPITPAKILLGKYLGVLSIVLALLFMSLLYPAIVNLYGQPYWPQIWTTYLGYTLFLVLYVAIGIWASLLTENQLVAAVITYAAFFLSFLIGYLAHLMGPPFDAMLANFLVIEHLRSFRVGLLFLGDIVVYGAGTVIFLLFAYLRLKRHYP